MPTLFFACKNCFKLTIKASSLLFKKFNTLRKVTVFFFFENGNICIPFIVLAKYLPLLNFTKKLKY